MVLKKPKKKTKYFPNYFVLVGILLLAVALIIPALTFTPVIKSEINYQLTSRQPPPTLEIIPVDQEFSLIIPKINANAKVIKNVDPFDPKIYQTALTHGVAHARSTSTPDAFGNTFIFAHSARNWYQANQFNAVFYLLNKLEKDDQIIVYYQSQKYNYSVTDVKLVDGNQINYLSSSPHLKQLTLMTCWPPGTTLKRLLVIAKAN